MKLLAVAIGSSVMEVFIWILQGSHHINPVAVLIFVRFWLYYLFRYATTSGSLCCSVQQCHQLQVLFFYCSLIHWSLSISDHRHSNTIVVSGCTMMPGASSKVSIMWGSQLFIKFQFCPEHQQDPGPVVLAEKMSKASRDFLRQRQSPNYPQGRITLT